MHQTPADGNAVLPIYLFFAVLTGLILLPLTPFLHRFSYRIATFLFVVFIACLIYNLTAFPFSSDSRLKIYFLQSIDLNSGENNVTLAGLDGYLQDIADELPSTSGQSLRCGKHSAYTNIVGVQRCSWNGLAPNVLGENIGVLASTSSKKPKKPKNEFESWIDYNVTSANGTAIFHIRGLKSKQCRLLFDNAVSAVNIDDASPDPRYQSVAENGSSQVRLFSRDFSKTFSVAVSWASGKSKGQTGRVMCGWSDVNQPGLIPAYDEVRRFQPTWSAVVKASDGLVEGFKDFELQR